MPPQISQAQASTKPKRHKTSIPYGFGEAAPRYAKGCKRCQENLKNHPDLWTTYDELTDHFKNLFPINNPSSGEDIAKSLLGLFEHKKKTKYGYPEIIQTVFVPVINDHHKHADYNLSQPTLLPENTVPESSSSNAQASSSSMIVNPVGSPLDEWFKGMPETEKESLFLNKWFSDLSLEKKRVLFQSANCGSCSLRVEFCNHDNNFNSLNLEPMDYHPTALDPELQHQ